MNWGQYVTLVKEHLGVDADRRGIEHLRSRAIKNSVIDLQRFIPGFRAGHVKIWSATELVAQQHAMLGSLPEGAVPQAFYIYSTKADSNGVTHAQCRKNRLGFMAWIDRQHMVCDRCLNPYVYAISPTGRSFMIHPALNTETELELRYDGLKQEFSDVDTVPFPVGAAEASGAYAKWRILLEVDKRLDLAQLQYQIYQQRRLSLFRDWQDTQSAEKPDDVDGQIIDSRIRTDIHSWDELAALPTAAFAVPILVGWTNAATGILTWTELVAGTEESDVDSGIIRPEDYSPALNEKYWKQV